MCGRPPAFSIRCPDSALPLLVSGVQTNGTNPTDYLISTGCQQALAPGASCQIGVRFAPASQGASTATLTVLSNSATPPEAVTLSGTGGPPMQSAPAPVTSQASASQSSASSHGQQKPAGDVICDKPVRGSAQCEIEFAPGTAIQGKSVQSTFKVDRGSRNDVHGTLTLKRGATARRGLRLAPGSYTLLISTGSGRRTKTLLRLAFRVR